MIGEKWNGSFLRGFVLPFGRVVDVFERTAVTSAATASWVACPSISVAALTAHDGVFFAAFLGGRLTALEVIFPGADSLSCWTIVL